MRPIILFAFLFTLLPLPLLGKEVNISYRDNETTIKFNDEVINATGYQINISLVKNKCNKFIFTSALKELNAITERVYSNMFHSKESVDNIVIAIENGKKEIISPRTTLGKRILSIRSFLDKLKFQEDKLCSIPQNSKI
jgi:uncharacterized protein YaaN involved in tellurite resistance